MIKKEKKGASSHKRKQDGDEKKNGHKKKKSLDENNHSMEQCLKIVANLEDLEMKERNMALLAEHLVICKFTISLKKMLNHIPFKLDKKTGEPIILCGGCQLHCVGNWNLPNPTARPSKESPLLLMK